MSTEAHQSEFDEKVVTFYMSLAENKLEETLSALYQLKISPKTDPQLKQVHVEMVDNCTKKASDLFSAQVLEELRNICKGEVAGKDAFHYFAMANDLGVGRKASLILSGYVRKMYKQRSRGAIDKMRKAGGPGSKLINEHGYVDRSIYIETMGEILTDASNVMSSICEACGENVEAKETILLPVDEECASFALEIIEVFYKDARVASWERRAIRQGKQDICYSSNISAMQVEADESLQMIDLLLSELGFIINLAARYDSYILSTIGLSNRTSRSPFQNKVLELGGVYVLLERFYLFQIIHKASEIAESQEIEPNVFVSSAVDDVHIVLVKSFTRAAQSGFYGNALSVVIAIIDALESMYLPSIVDLPNKNIALPGHLYTSLSKEEHENALKAINNNNQESRNKHDGTSSENNDGTFSDALLLAVEEDLSSTFQEEAKIILSINSAFVSKECTSNLEDLVRDYSSRLYPSDGQILDCVPKHLSELIEYFYSIVCNGIDLLLKRSILSDLRELIQSQQEYLNYDIDAQGYNAMCDKDRLPLEILADLHLSDKTLVRYQKLMKDDAFTILLQKCSDVFCAEIEKCLKRMNGFSDWGVMLLERELRSVMSKFNSNINTGSLSKQFSRLEQVVCLLNFEKPSDLLEYTSIYKELGIADVAYYMHLRKSFNSESIDKVLERVC